MMIALHAWRSRAAIELYRRNFPNGALIVGLSGTDVYDYLTSDPEPTLRSLQLADRLVGLHERIAERLPPEFRDKLTIIRQSAELPPASEPSDKAASAFEVLVVGHLRAVKDPLRAAEAARGLPASSKIRIVHLGAAMSPEWDTAAREEMARNPRYVWLGEVDHDDARQRLARANAIVLSSVSEGGANVVSEAAVAGVPVLSSRIDAVVALLGEDYPGYFEVGDTAALTVLLHRIENDAALGLELRSRLRSIAAAFAPELERETWRELIEEVVAERGPAASSAALQATKGEAAR